MARLGPRPRRNHPGLAVRAIRAPARLRPGAGRTAARRVRPSAQAPRLGQHGSLV